MTNDEGRMTRDEWRGTNWVGCKGSVAYATEILQILKKSNK